MLGVDKNVSHPSYDAQEGDIAIHGVFQMQRDSGKPYTTKPLYFIREGSPYNLKSYIPDLGLHIRLERIEPETETFHLLLAQPVEKPVLSIEFAEEVPRNDYIVLKAILFPGINLFWAGSLLMLIGMAIGMYKRLRKA